jgi:hypothetical protein
MISLRPHSSSARQLKRSFNERERLSALECIVFPQPFGAGSRRRLLPSRVCEACTRGGPDVDKPAAFGPSKAAKASWKSPVEIPPLGDASITCRAVFKIQPGQQLFDGFGFAHPLIAASSDCRAMDRAAGSLI